MRFFAAFLLGLACLSATPACAVTVGADQAGDSVRRLVAGYIRPAFHRFAENAELSAAAVNALCEQPGDGTLRSARQAFRESALSFARVGFLRIGPLLQENRLERLLFWPDRRGIALRQVQGVLAGSDDSVTDPANLPAKSVGLQGFTALEFLLFGTGSDDLAGGAAHRCRFAEAVARNILTIAAELDAEWQDEAGFAATWSAPGPDNASYRDAEEVVSELLSVPSEAFEVIRDQRLKPVLPEGDGGTANPKRALFWRSGLTMDYVAAGFDGLRAYYETAAIADLLPDDKSWQARSVEFEFNNAASTLARLNMPIEDIVAGADSTADLAYLVILSQSLQSLFGEQLTATLGLSVGFSSLDGD
ncbi:MAG: imelysin family protein [Oricola sp.]